MQAHEKSIRTRYAGRQPTRPDGPLMGWARIDDGLHDHPKMMGLSLGAIGLWTLSLSWAHRHHGAGGKQLGYIPPDLPSRLGGRAGKRLANELQEHGLWEVNSEFGGWLIHDYVDYLPASERPTTADEVREARREAGKRGAAARWGTTDGEADPSQADGKLLSGADGKPMPPTRPDPNLTNKQRKKLSAKPSDTDDAFTQFWDAYPRKTAKAAARRKFDTLVKNGTDPGLIIAGARRYAAERQGEDPKYTKQPDGWLNAGRWEDEPPGTSLALVRTPGPATSKAQGWLDITRPHPGATA